MGERAIKFFRWIKTSFEDDHNHASHRKLTTFSFVVLMWVMVFFTAYNGNPNTFPDTVWAMVSGGALGMSAIRAWATKPGNHDK